MTQILIQTPKAIRRTRRILSGLVLGGGLVAATAIVMAVPSEPEAQAHLPAHEAPSAPEWAQTFEPPASAPAAIPEATVTLGEAEIEPLEVVPEPEPAPAFEIAIAHEDTETDFSEKAHTLRDQGETKDALTAMRKHLHAREATVDELFFVGQLARRLRQTDLAVAALEAAAEVAPTQAVVHTELARVQLDARNLEEADLAADRAIAADRLDPMAWNLKGRVAMAASHWHRAESALSYALELDPLDPMLHNNLGLLYVYMRRGEDAVDALETAVELYDDDAPHFVFNNLGLAQELTGRYDEAREAFEEALLVSPFYARAKVNLRRVETELARLETAAEMRTAQAPTLDDDT